MSEEPVDEQSIFAFGDREEALALPLHRKSSCLTCIRWKVVLFVAAILISMATVWMSSSTLFDIPRDIRMDRKNYSSAKQRFLEDPHYWYCQWVQFEYSIRQALRQGKEQEIPSILLRVTPQALIAFLVNQTDARIERLRGVATLPKVMGSSFVISLSKPEADAWPFIVMLSAELKVTFDSEGPILTVSRLRRGSQELPPNLTWAYFRPELERMKGLSKQAITSRAGSIRDPGS